MSHLAEAVSQSDLNSEHFHRLTRLDFKQDSLKLKHRNNHKSIVSFCQLFVSHTAVTPENIS